MARRTTWRDLITVGVTAALLVVVADLALRRVAPPVVQREVDDAVGEYLRVDPTILVIGSSHARTFDVPVNGGEVKNEGALRNPESLQAFRATAVGLLEG